MGPRFCNVCALTLFAMLWSGYSLFGQMEDFAQTNLSKADSMARLYSNYSLYDIKGLAEKLTANLATDIEKFRAIYLWICYNIDNDYALYQLNKLRREKIKDPLAQQEWNKEFHNLVVEMMLQKKRTVCTGYAYLVRELALYAGLSCVMIDGYGRTGRVSKGVQLTPNHSWNAVQLNDKWYLCDPTWSSGAIDAQTKRFLRRFNDSYFLADPRVFIQKHYPADSAWMLVDKNNRPTLEEFLNRPLFAQ
jgi:transglutaminase/protease-like cytokinesis protein 3